jgi:nicotinamidase-related amidase
MATRLAPTPMATPSLAPSKQVLLLVDFMNPLDFPGSGELAPGAVKAAAATAGLKKRLARRGVTTIYANDNYGVWQSDFHSLVASCLGKGGPSAEIAQLLFPQAEDLTILKPRHSAFYGTPLELMLRAMATEHLVICGLATDMCVQMTAADAFLRKIDIHVPADCCAAETPEAQRTALAWMKRILQCDVAASTAPAKRARR